MTTGDEERPPRGNEAARNETTGQGGGFRADGTTREQAVVIGVTVTVDISDLERAADGWAAVRFRLWNALVDLPAGTLVRLSVGRVSPMPETAHELGLGHVVIAVESPSWRVGEAWRRQLNGTPA